MYQKRKANDEMKVLVVGGWWLVVGKNSGG